MESDQRRRAPKRATDTLRVVLAHVEALADVRPDDDPDKLARILAVWNHTIGDVGLSVSADVPMKAVAIDREHREAVKVYVTSWIVPQLRATIDYLDGASERETFGMEGL